MEPLRSGEARLRTYGERLVLDTHVVRDRAVVVDRDVVDTLVRVAIPILVEELVVRERTLGESYVTNDAIVEPQRLDVRLSSETVAISRRTVAYEDVLVGTRGVERIVRVGADLRRERPTVDGADLR